jgi:hypothetical protein
MRVLGKRVLREMFGPKRETVTSGWRKLYSLKILKSSTKLQDGHITGEGGGGRTGGKIRKKRMNKSLW